MVDHRNYEERLRMNVALALFRHDNATLFDCTKSEGQRFAEASAVYLRRADAALGAIRQTKARA